MAESATTAPPKDTKKGNGIASAPGAILAKIERYAADNPDDREYWLDNELEAAAILVAMAASLKYARKTTGPLRQGIDGHTLKKFERIYRSKAAQGKALQYFREIAETERLEIYGLRLMARRIVLN